jgi:hypothetical protein
METQPADHGVGFQEDQDVRPSGPTVAECRPEESVQGVQFWPRPFSFQHGDLLSEGEDFEGGIAWTAKENSDGDKESEDDFEHEAPFYKRNVASRGPPLRNRMLLISSHHAFLSTDR